MRLWKIKMAVFRRKEIVRFRPEADIAPAKRYLMSEKHVKPGAQHVDVAFTSE
jgi:hypothetical protein